MSIPIREETRKEYEDSANEFFGHGTSHKNLGKSADDIVSYARHLPGKEAEYRLAERYATGFDKAKRSGAFSKASTGFAIRPSGGKFASDFVDEHTPGKYKPAPNPWGKNIPTEQTTVTRERKLACVITALCMDCLKPINYNVPEPDVVTNLFTLLNVNHYRLNGMGLQFGDFCASVFHFTCAEKVKAFKKETLPLVRGGALLSEKDRNLIIKYKQQIQLHDGQEITVGHWKMAKRLEKISAQTQDYIIEQRKAGNLDIFREDRR